MFRRKLICVSALVGLMALGVSCKKASTTPAAATAPVALAAVRPPMMDAILRLHWLGKKKMSADTNAFGVAQLWNLPESVNLQAQTLDKLSSAPWRLWLGETNLASTNLLRPLLEDIVDAEGYVEVGIPSNSTNAPVEIIVAVRLENPRAGLWETNLAAVLQSLTDIQPTNSAGSNSQGARRWSLRKPGAPGLIEFARAGEWTILAASQDHNILLDETIDRIERNHSPVPAATTNSWLEADFDLQRLADVGGVNPGIRVTLPKISLTVAGEAQNVVTRGQLFFPAVESAGLSPWNIPTNVVSADLGSFTAIRGIKPWLELSKIWANLQAGPAPDQIYFWGLRGFPLESYIAVPLLDASNTVSRLSDLALQGSSTPLVTNFLAGFQRSKTFNGLAWHGFPYFSPFLRSIQTNGESFALGGFIEGDFAGGPPPLGLLKEILSRTNLVYYDWEVTGPRIGQWIYLGQAIRYASGAAQLATNSPSLRWLQAMTTRLGVSGTEVVRTEPGKLSFVRNSSLGFTAVEFQLLADWLESPDFPKGLQTLLAKPPEESSVPGPP